MLRFRLREIVACALAFMLGAVTAFLGAGPALFADGSPRERIIALAIAVLIEMVLGLVIGALAPSLWKIAAVCLVAPLVPVTLLFADEAFSSVATALVVVGFLLGCTAAALFGALMGARFRRR